LIDGRTLAEHNLGLMRLGRVQSTFCVRFWGLADLATTRSSNFCPSRAAAEQAATDGFNFVWHSSSVRLP